MTSIRIPYPTAKAEECGISPQQWRVLVNTTFPNAMTEEAILNAWDLCVIRGLDPFGGHIAIVNQRQKIDNNWINRETCWLTLKAQIALAHRTGAFAGIDPVVYGPVRNFEFIPTDTSKLPVTIECHEYITATVYRMVSGQRCSFSETVFFLDMVPLSYGLPNAMWNKSPSMMLAKCAKAAVLRLGFEGCDYSADEMDGKSVNPAVSEAEPDQLAAYARKESTKPAAPVVQPFATVDQFSDDDAQKLFWALENATAIGSYDLVVNELDGIVTPPAQAVATNIIMAAKDVSTDAQGNRLVEYLFMAHNRNAYDAALDQILQQASNHKISQPAADGAATVLNFLQDLANRGLQTAS